MNHFCTLFNKIYALQGVALFQSLVRHASDPFTLHVACMDEETFDLISRLSKLDSRIQPISRSDIETEEYKKYEPNFAFRQKFWVCQPLLCTHLLGKGFDRITYLEADSLFFADPKLIFAEMGENSVTVVPHRYSAGFDQTAVSGIYCVQFNAFKNDPRAHEILEFWTKENFKYSAEKPYTFPGQTCLDQWPSKFAGVKIIEQLGAGTAPWNIQQYKVVTDPRGVAIGGQPLVFYHFHEFCWYTDGDFELGGYPLSSDVVNLIYTPYIEELAKIEKWLLAQFPNFHFKKVISKPSTLKGHIKSFLRKVRGRYNVYPSLPSSSNRDGA